MSISRRTLLGGAVAATQLRGQVTVRPNVLVILFDDLGVQDLGYLGAGDLQTPNIDRLAVGGTLCRNWYSNAPVCAPARAALLTGQNERAVFEVLLQREKLGTTAVGYGVAIPHGKLPKLEKLFGLFARLERPIDFEAMDGQPVDLVFLLLAPEGAGADHLKALARIARLLRDQDVAKKLRASRDAQAIYSVLALPPASAA